MSHSCWHGGRGVTEAAFGVAGEFLNWFFTRAPEREMFVNWLAWSLQNEEDKPNWAPFFYSGKMGTGKSAMGRVLIRLFGEANAVTQNNVDKLTGRFNMTLLRSKLVICEEVNLKPGSGDANTLKTYITEKFTAGEAKGKETERVEQHVCLVLTSNHLPFWIEPEDRRYYIVSEPPRLYRRVICSMTRRPYRVCSGLHRTPPLLLRG